jgi:hypothetical protein
MKRPTIKALVADNKRLRRALKAERAYWKHVLFCPECCLHDILQHQCHEAQDLRFVYMDRMAQARKKSDNSSP